MPTIKQGGSVNLVTKFYAAPLFKTSKGIADILEVPDLVVGGSPVWSDRSDEVIKVLVAYLRANQEDQIIKALRSLNKHWCASISHLVTGMKPAVLDKDDFPFFEKAMQQRFVNVRKLELPAAWMEDSYCARIANFKNLSSLDFFWYDNATDEGLKHIASMPNLTSLKVYHCRQITDKGLKLLAKSTIEELWLYGGVQVSDTGLSYLSSCNSLKQLRLMYCNTITKRGLESFVNRPDMKLTVRFCRRIPCDIHIT